VLASEVVQDLVGRVLTRFDGHDAFIAQTSTHIDQLAYPDGTTAFDVLGDLMGLDGAFYWAAWQTIPASGKYRFEWLPWPVSVRYEADVVDGFDSPGSAADLYNSAVVRWKDRSGATRSTTVMSSVQALTDAGLIRSAAIDLGDEVGSAANAVSAGQAFLAEHAVPSNRGTLTLSRPVLDLERGRLIWPWEIRPGGLIRVRGIHPRADALNATGRDGSTVFRIVSTTFSARDASAELELDAYSRSTSQAIAALQSRSQQRRR
jgi:hypothetical protein